MCWPIVTSFTGPVFTISSSVRNHCIQKTMPDPLFFKLRFSNLAIEFWTSISWVKSNLIIGFGSASARQGYSQRGSGSTSASLIIFKIKVITFVKIGASIGFIIRCLMVSTDQADPICFYFRISWILMERHWSYFFRPLHLVQGLRSLEHGLLQKLSMKNFDQKFRFFIKK